MAGIYGRLAARPGTANSKSCLQLGTAAYWRRRSGARKHQTYDPRKVNAAVRKEGRDGVIVIIVIVIIVTVVVAVIVVVDGVIVSYCCSTTPLLCLYPLLFFFTSSSTIIAYIFFSSLPLPIGLSCISFQTILRHVRINFLVSVSLSLLRP